MESIFDVIIIGGGVMGSATAYYLSKELDGSKILLLEQFDFLHRKGSSHGESRIIRTTYPEEHYTFLMKDSYKLWLEAENEYGSKIFTKTGGIDFSKKNNNVIKSVLKSAKKYNVPIEILSNEKIMKKFPNIKLSNDYIGIYSPDGGTLNATKAVAMFQYLAKQNQCKLLDNTGVIMIEELKSNNNNNNYIIIQTNTRKIFLTKKLIVTTGAWTKKLLKQCEEIEIPLKPIKTTIAYWKVQDSNIYSYKNFPVFINYGEPNIYGCPANEYPNMIKCSAHYGLPCDPDKRDFDPDNVGIKDVKKFLEIFFIGVEHVPTMTESCMYTLTPDHGFIIDNIPSSKNIFIGCGFSGHGFKLAPIVGKILSQLVLTGQSPYPTIQQHFKLDRFKNIGQSKL